MSTALEAEALKRKERLAALKRKNVDGGEAPADAEGSDKAKKPLFRSYVPKDDALKESVLPKVAPENVETHIQEQLDAVKQTRVLEEVDLSSLAPRKIDWDLKRDVASKLEKLDRRTQRAIAELIRERLASGPQQDADLLSAVNANARAALDAHASDDDDD